MLLIKKHKQKLTPVSGYRTSLVIPKDIPLEAGTFTVEYWKNGNETIIKIIKED